MPPMKCCSTAILASLIVTTPTINGYPSSDIPLISIQKPSAIPDLQRLSYDEIVDLLELIESDSFEEKLLVLEAMAEGGSTGVNIGEVIASANRAITAGEELGFTAKEVAGLKQSGELERIIAKGRDFFTGNPELQASYDLFKNAKDTLKPYVKKPMPETNIRQLIHQSGIPTFERPAGIPANYLVRISEKGAGIEYVHPTLEKTSIRVMPGMPHSPNPSQQIPYVVHLIENKAVDKYGNFVNPKSPKAHVPLDEFIYQEEVFCGYK